MKWTAFPYISGTESCRTSIREFGVGKPHRSKKGNSMIRVIRRVLYIPMIAAGRYNPIVKIFAERLKKAGKPNMVIMSAVMRKLLHIIYGMLKSGVSFGSVWSTNHA